MEKVNFKGLNPEEIAIHLKKYDVPSYRAKQIFQWIYEKRVDDFNEMSNLSKDFRVLLNEHFEIKKLKMEEKAVSKDGTIKYLFDLGDGSKIESVLLPPLSVNRLEKWIEEDTAPNRLTICISTQVGCPLGCTFCATGYMKYKRNLSVYEIIDQVMQVEGDSGKKITNIVFMGMGEPLLNYDNVAKAIGIINHEMGLSISNKHITVSTSGIVPGIKRLADENKKFRLAVSLHALNDETRSKLMPINDKYNLYELIESLQYYYQKTKSRITFEYILFDGLNDTEKDIRDIIHLSKSIPCKFNMIQFHGSDIFSSELKRSSRFNEIISRLRDENVTVMVRNSSGEDIAAACGQLAIKNKN
jgi:23S rRNA (adenine2503-C2)-methyltransferase